MLNSCPTRSIKEEAVEVELAVKEDDKKILRTKLDKERKGEVSGQETSSNRKAQGSNRCQ